jgi:hypothetical protein
MTSAHRFQMREIEAMRALRILVEASFPTEGQTNGHEIPPPDEGGKRSP